MFKVVDERPTEGQFVMVWVFGGVLWSSVFKVEDGEYFIYYEEVDEWVPEDAHLGDTNVVQYLIKGE